MNLLWHFLLLMKRAHTNTHTYTYTCRNAMQIKDRAILNMQTCESCIWMCALLSVKQHISIEKNFRKRCRAMKLFCNGILCTLNEIPCSSDSSSHVPLAYHIWWRSFARLLACFEEYHKRTSTIVKFMNFHIDERAN